MRLAVGAPRQPTPSRSGTSTPATKKGRYTKIVNEAAQPKRFIDAVVLHLREELQLVRQLTNTAQVGIERIDNLSKFGDRIINPHQT